MLCRKKEKIFFFFPTMQLHDGLIFCRKIIPKNLKSVNVLFTCPVTEGSLNLYVRKAKCKPCKVVLGKRRGTDRPKSATLLFSTLNVL